MADPSNTEAEGRVDPDRLTDEARADLAERLEDLDSRMNAGYNSIYGEDRAAIREAAAALRSTPEAGSARAEEAGKRVVDEYPETLRRLGENQITSSGPLPASPLLALAEELEARADEQSGDYQVPICDWSVRRWSQLRAWKGATLAYRKAAALARDYATREESDDG